MSKKSAAKRKPKSQSEIAVERKSKAIEDAGTAIINGNPGKAAELLKGKPLDPKQAVSIVTALRIILLRIEVVRHKIEAVKEEFTDLKTQEKRLLIDLCIEVRDGHQGRLPFGDTAATDPVEAEMGAKPNTIENAVDGDEGRPPPSQRAERPRGKRNRTVTHRAVGASS